MTSQRRNATSVTDHLANRQRRNQYSIQREEKESVKIDHNNTPSKASTGKVKILGLAREAYRATTSTPRIPTIGDAAPGSSGGGWAVATIRG
jgi:hypothetical protein